MSIGLDDYMDADVAYLAGLIMARGSISESQGIRQLVIEFPYSSLQVAGIDTTFNQETSIRLGLMDIRERLLDLLNTDISIIRKHSGVDLVIRFVRNSLAWRDILLLTDSATSYPYFRVPPVFFSSDMPQEWKREFVRGYADVAGNIRHANRFVDGRNRVRLDVLNYPTNWEMPVQICRLLQDHLDVPVQLITWGHPNLGRDFREHQLNIFAQPFLNIGFTFEHKQKLLEEFAKSDSKTYRLVHYEPCPGSRKLRGSKPRSIDEDHAEKFDARLAGNHYNAYWQICRALGCTRWQSAQSSASPARRPITKRKKQQKSK